MMDRRNRGRKRKARYNLKEGIYFQPGLTPSYVVLLHNQLGTKTSTLEYDLFMFKPQHGTGKIS